MKKIIIFTLSFFASLSVLSQDIPNSGFENWSTVSNYEDPDGWATYNSYSDYYSAAGYQTTLSSIKSTDSYQGNYALQLQSYSVDDLAGNVQYAYGILFTGYLNINTFSFIFGSPYNLRPDSLAGYFKYTSPTNEPWRCSVLLTRWNTATNMQDTIAESIHIGDTASAYSRFATKLDYLNNLNPDTMLVVFANTSGSNGQGNVLMLDELEMVFNNLGITSGSFQNIEFYPNPCSESVTVSNHETGVVSIYNAQGEFVKSLEKLSYETLVVPTDDMSSGLYFFHFKDRINKISVVR